MKEFNLRITGTSLRFQLSSVLALPFPIPDPVSMVGASAPSDLAGLCSVVG